MRKRAAASPAIGAVRYQAGHGWMMPTGAILAPRLTEFPDRLSRRGIHLGDHHHLGTVVESGAEIDRLLAVTGDGVGLLLDTGHLAFAGADPAAIARRYGHRVNHVHCQDVQRDMLASVRAGDASFLAAVLDGVFTVPGNGCIDSPRCSQHSRRRTIAAGWSSRRSRIRQRRRRSLMPGSVSHI